MQNNIELKPNNKIIHKLNLLFKQNSIANKERILSIIANNYAVLFGLKQDNINVKLLNEQIIGANSELFMGNFNKDAPNTIFINLANIDNPIKIISVIAHELTHLIDNSKNIFIPNDITQNKRAIHNGYLASYHAIKAQINKDNQLIYLYEPLIKYI
ncbi:hypothetical protein [Campylobacter majalis]|uniref:hypothetical protein n=1 Tax=Campylobacter majalis TaxID=2790656 RepID=UPI003D690271